MKKGARKNVGSLDCRKAELYALNMYGVTPCTSDIRAILANYISTLVLQVVEAPLLLLWLCTCIGGYCIAVVVVGSSVLA